mmetsp:Transcript_54420/g.167520  ORF Transcript_54420/g.167520 Transcript_54420/m.167520 type:complete len:269 (+) Transcript_54420:935-1741(+)
MAAGRPAPPGSSEDASAEGAAGAPSASTTGARLLRFPRRGGRLRPAAAALSVPVPPVAPSAHDEKSSGTTPRTPRDGVLAALARERVRWIACRRGARVPGGVLPARGGSSASSSATGVARGSSVSSPSYPSASPSGRSGAAANGAAAARAENSSGAVVSNHGGFELRRRTGEMAPSHCRDVGDITRSSESSRPESSHALDSRRLRRPGVERPLIMPGLARESRDRTRGIPPENPPDNDNGSRWREPDDGCCDDRRDMPGERAKGSGPS